MYYTLFTKHRRFDKKKKIINLLKFDHNLLLSEDMVEDRSAVFRCRTDSQLPPSSRYGLKGNCNKFST